MVGTWMFQLHLVIVTDVEENEEDQAKRNLQVILTTLSWVKKAVDLGCIMSYKAICDTCKGNGYIYVTNTKGTTEPKQCWICESEGEINWSQAEVDKLIYNTYYRKRLH